MKLCAKAGGAGFPPTLLNQEMIFFKGGLREQGGEGRAGERKPAHPSVPGTLQLEKPELLGWECLLEGKASTPISAGTRGPCLVAPFAGL